MELITRQLCLAQHVGTKDILFGGQMLAWADVAASIWCMRLVRSDHMVTVHMSDIDFLAPVRVGDIVEFYGEEYQVGKSSVTVRIAVKVLDPTTGHTTDAFVFNGTMVNIDRNLKPKPLAVDVQNTSSASTKTRL